MTNCLFDGPIRSSHVGYLYILNAAAFQVTVSDLLMDRSSHMDYYLKISHTERHLLCITLSQSVQIFTVLGLLYADVSFQLTYVILMLIAG